MAPLPSFRKNPSHRVALAIAANGIDTEDSAIIPSSNDFAFHAGFPKERGNDDDTNAHHTCETSKTLGQTPKRF